MWDFPLCGSAFGAECHEGLRGRSTPVQVGWGTTGSLRSLGAGRQAAGRGATREVFTTALLFDVRSELCVISKGERKRKPGRRCQTRCQCPLFNVKIQVNRRLLSVVIYGL